MESNTGASQRVTGPVTIVPADDADELRVRVDGIDVFTLRPSAILSARLYTLDDADYSSLTVVTVRPISIFRRHTTTREAADDGSSFAEGRRPVPVICATRFVYSNDSDHAACRLAASAPAASLTPNSERAGTFRVSLEVHRVVGAVTVQVTALSTLLS